MSNSTLQEPVFWEPELGHRGTFSIVLSCFSTLAISLWSALHLSIPRKRRTWKQNLGVKLMWMVMGLFLPEVLILIAMGQFQTACRIRNEVNAHFEPENQPKSWYKGWFRGHPGTNPDEEDEERMLVEKSSGLSSGLLVSQEPSNNITNSPDSKDVKVFQKQVLSLTVHKTPPSGRHHWTITHGFYAIMGGFAFYDDNGELRVLDHTAILEMLQTSPNIVPNISIENIHSAGRSDGLSKLLLVIQLGWFCISSIGRLFQHLPLTLLEVSTLTHALCAVITYAIWWHKPLNVEEPLIISEPGPLRYNRQWDRAGNIWSIEEIPSSHIMVLLPMLIIPPVYGAPHLAAWNSYFATNTEQLLWRISACVVTGLPLLGFPLIVILDMSEGHHSYARFKPVKEALDLVLFFIFPLLYLPANLFLIAESLRQLFHLPPAAFQTMKWVEYFPHL